MMQSVLQSAQSQMTPCRLTCVETADAAIGRLQKEGFDLVIADENLPFFKGHELARWIHENLTERLIPVILTSDQQSSGSRRSATLFSEMIRQGIIALFIPKPFGTQQFISMVHLALTMKPAAAARSERK